MSLSDFNDCFGVSFDVEEYDTIGGYLFGTFGHVPAQGEIHDADGWRMKVEELDGRRIRSVRLSPLLDQD
jgi:CBS domain containing-hemolysin-like protein